MKVPLLANEVIKIILWPKISTISSTKNRLCIQLVLSMHNILNPDTKVGEVSLFHGLINCMAITVLGERKGVLIREVSSFQGCP